jgi:arylsulfatase
MTMISKTYSTVALASFALALSSNETQAADSTNNSKPNIIYFLADDLGIGELGCYGQEYIETPNIDRLAKQGKLFNNMYSGSAVSAPSRGTFITGRHTGHGQVRGNKGAPILGQFPLEPNTPTIASMLKKEGYKSGIVGKWGLGGPYTESQPTDQGFDFFFGILDQWRAHNYYMTYYYRNKTAVPNMNVPQDLHAHLLKCQDVNNPANYRKYNGRDYAPTLMIKEALGFIERNQKNPFFLYYATPIPHVALQAPRKWVSKYRKKFKKLGIKETPFDGIHGTPGGGYLPCQYPRATYAAMVSYMDYNLGLILNKLDELGLTENTIVIFTSDNGPTFNGGTDSKFFKSARNSRGLKCSLYEGGIRVPFIAKWPGKIKPGTVTDQLGGFWDMMATFAEITGATAPENDGVSLLPALVSDQKVEHPNGLYWEEGTRQQALRMGDWKIIRVNPRGAFELYNLKEDESESKNLAKSNPEKFNEMKKLIEAARTPNKNFPLKGVDVPAK